MKPLYEAIFTLTKAAILRQQPDSVCGIDDWQELFLLLRSGKLQGVTYKTVSSLPEAKNAPEHFLTAWKTTVFQNGMKQLSSTQEVRFVLQRATERGLAPVLFKGLVLAALYPEPSMRFSSDADIYIPTEQRLSMEQLLTSLGYALIPEASKEHVPVYRINTGNRCLTIELHDCLWEDYTGTQANILDSLHLTAPDTFITQSPFGFPILTLGHTEHLIYQIFHMAKHFAFEGLRLRFLTDLTLFVNAYKNEVDFVRFWDTMEKLGYSSFALALLNICYCHLGLTEGILTPQQKKKTVNEMVTEDILLVGKVTAYKVENWASTDLLASYFMRDRGASSGTQHKLEIFFPMPSALKDKFSYARKCPLLLPVAWIHRFFSAFLYSMQCKKNNQSASDVLSNAEYRLALMKSVGLVDTK